MGKIWIILNPIAGKGRALRFYPRIEQFLRGQGIPYEFYLTSGPDDGLKFVKSCPFSAALPGEDDVVVAAGGDGTCNEVVNGLLTHDPPLKKMPLFGLIPIGRGNDFSFSAGLSPDPEAALDLLIHGPERPLDAGFVQGGFFPQGRYFVNGLGIGFDTKVGFDAARMKHVHSSLAYVLGALINIVRYDPSPVLRIRYNGGEAAFPAILVSLMNGRRMGGVFYMGPHAILDDGLLDICCIRRPATRRRLMKLVLQYPKGAQGNFEETTMDRAPEYHLEALEGSMAAHCDGETVCYEGRELTVRCVPQALRLIGGPR